MKLIKVLLFLEVTAKYITPCPEYKLSNSESMYEQLSIVTNKWQANQDTYLGNEQINFY